MGDIEAGKGKEVVVDDNAYLSVTNTESTADNASTIADDESSVYVEDTHNAGNFRGK